MSRQVLGKRSHSSFSTRSPTRSSTPASKSRHASFALELPSPDPTPNPKRVKTSSTETQEEDGSNKENIPPDAVLDASNDASSLSTDTGSSIANMSARELRAHRRAAVTPATSRRASSSRSQHDASSSYRTSSSPPASRRAGRPRVAAATTPTKSMAQLTLATPPSTPATMPPALHEGGKDAVITTQPSLHTIVRALLRPHANNATPLVGREHERIQIVDFVDSFISRESRTDEITSLYVSGAPGTGKTALVNEVLASVASRNSETMDVDHASLHVVYVNCMALGGKDGMTGVWERCSEQFGVQKAKQRGLAAKVDWNERFGNLLRGHKCVLVLDEIDHLLASTASISTSQVFAIAASPQCRSSLRVIGISNTHTLTDSKPSAYSKTIHFQPYTAAQMKAVLGKRLESLSASGFDGSKVFPVSTIALLAFKIANQTGDIRAVFSVARRALDLAATGSQASAALTVTPAHVLAALKTSNASLSTSQFKRDGMETVTRVRNLGLHSRFAFVALLLATKRVASGFSLTASGSSASSGSLKENAHPPSSSHARDTTAPSIEMTTLHGFYSAILNKGAQGAFHVVGRTEFGDLIGLLEGSGLVELTQGRGFGSKTRSPMKAKGTQFVSVAKGVREDELVRGLVGSTDSPATEDGVVNIMEEEVKNVWERETRRLEREVKARFGSATKNKADFEGAEEN